MNAREGIKTIGFAVKHVVHVPLKTMNAREGIKTE